MRGLCTEEDYAFLGMSEKTTEEAAGASGDDWRDKKEERVRGEENLNKNKTLHLNELCVCLRSAGDWRGSNRKKRDSAK